MGTPPRSRRRRLAWAATLCVAVPLGAVIALAAIPSSNGDLASHPDPAANHAQALERFAAIRAEEERLGVFSECRSQLLEHGRTTDVVVVLFHGLTNCPRQFAQLGEQLHAQGATGDLTAQELRDYADTAVDIADGLGTERRVLGLSMGGVLAAWVTQNRSDVARSVVVSPALTLPVGPGFLNAAFRNLLGRLPNVDVPGSDKTGMHHIYAGEATRGLVAMYRVADEVRSAAAVRPPAVRTIAVDWNANDNQVRNSDVRSLAAAWAAHGAQVETHEFPAALGLPHDLIDPAQPTGDVSAVYPRLLEQLGFAG